jgi:hypothetical protein
MKGFKMNHQLFESWLLEAENLTPDQRQELSEHLKSCASCRRLQGSLSVLDHMMVQAVPVAPAPGFAQRFQSGLAARRKQRQARQLRMILSIFGGSLILVSMGIMIRFLTSHSLVKAIATLIEFTTTTPQRLLEFRYMISFWVNQIPAPVVAVSSILMASWVFILLIPWAFTFLQFNRQGATHK